jgi:hypothetical protein
MSRSRWSKIGVSQAFLRKEYPSFSSIWGFLGLITFGKDNGVHKYPSSYSLSADTSTSNSENFENIESSYPNSLSKYLKWVLVVGLRTAAA